MKALAACVLLGLLSQAASEAADCPSDSVPWNGRCFNQYEWTTDEKTCPAGVIVIAPGEKLPSCVPCEDFSGGQQPMNYCAGVRANGAERKLEEAFESALARHSQREAELRTGQSAWVKKRDQACRREERAYQGGSAAAGVYADCVFTRTTKRIAELQGVIEQPPTPQAETADTVRLPFHEFCTQAFAKDTIDESTLRALEQLTGVDDCDRLGEALQQMKSVENLEPFVGRRCFSSLTTLAYAPRLERLRLPYGCPVADLGPLATLTDLSEIEMSGTNVKDLKPLAKLEKLEVLDVRTSKVTDISPLMDLPKLRKLDLRNLHVPKADVDRFQTKHPGAEIEFAR